MSFLKVKNRVYSTLASGISDSDLSLTVATGEGALFPLTYPFHVTICIKGDPETNIEIVECPSRTGDVLTIVRAQEGTAAVSHSADELVELRITAEIITRLQKQVLDADGDTGFEVEQSADEDKIHGKVGGVEAFLFSGVGIQTLVKQSKGKAYRNSLQYIPDSAYTLVALNTEDYDIQDEIDCSIKSGTADATEASKLHDADGGFEATDVGKKVYNTIDKTYATVTAFVDSGELTLDTDIMADGEEYELYWSRFTATESGAYLAIGLAGYTSSQIVADKKYYTAVFKNGAPYAKAAIHASHAGSMLCLCNEVINLDANDYIDLRVYHSAGDTIYTDYGIGGLFLTVHKLS